MAKNVQIHIPEPCGENWENMGQAGMGRFCSSCSKTVVDFSLMSDQELLSYLGSQDRKVCGRFTADQLNRDIRLAGVDRKKSWAVVWRLALVGMLLSVKSQAQQIIPKARTAKLVKKKMEETTRTMGIIMILPEPGPAFHEISVLDSATSLPVSFATVRIDEGPKGFSADAAGKCRVPGAAIGAARTIAISSVGYAPRVIPMNEDLLQQDHWTISLSPQVASLGEFVVRTYDTKKLTTVMGGIVKMTRVDLQAADTVSRLLSDTLAFFGFRPNEVAVYPNPTPRGSVVRLSLQSGQTGTFHLGLYNSAGARMLERQLELTGKTQTELLSIPSSFSAGIYFIKMESPGSPKTYTQKLVVL